MEEFNHLALTRARVSRTAIEQLYVEMRHLVNRGYYKPWGATGKVIRESLLSLSPEIYGSMNDPAKLELNGLVYVIDRLPRGIEACRFIKLISEEGYKESGFETIIPVARRRNCYRIDSERMYIEVTRGRSEIYDILTHLTFLYVEADKIRRNALNDEGKPTLEWKKLKKIALKEESIKPGEQEVYYSYLSALTGRTFDETRTACERLESSKGTNNGLFSVVYWMGRLAIEEELEGKQREISFTPTLRERIGHHLYGERWANNIKAYLLEHNWIGRPIHIVSANLHSVMNSLYAYPALVDHFGKEASVEELADALSKPENDDLRQRVESFAARHGMFHLKRHAGTHIGVQVIDPLQLLDQSITPELSLNPEKIKKEKPIILVMDYAFGEQAFETMDELLKPFEADGKIYPMKISSISIMGKAGILQGGKGDLMIPSAHVFEGTADNYPFENDFSGKEFKGHGLEVYEGPMITVLGTSLQNHDILAYFKNSSWKAIGLEMEGAHYHKAIQSEILIRHNVKQPVTIRYAYYASDNPLETGSTLASGSLGQAGVKPAYLITLKILEKILGEK